MRLAELLQRRAILVCVGSGGVGKTTMAASLAVAGAMSGRRTMVLTIDPARRLAQSLGLASLTGTCQAIAPAVLEAAGLDADLQLAAGMLDQKGAWDELIARHAPSPEAERAILANPFYQQLSQSFAGSTEYMAVEELARIHESGAYDLIVLDTPPSRHALDFLEAPERLGQFLDRSVLGWFVRPSVGLGAMAWRTTSRSLRFLLGRIEDATGTSTLGQISDFFVAMDTIFDGLAERGRRVQALLRSPETAFVLVAGPEQQVLGAADHLTTRMAELGVPLRGVVMNRVHPLAVAGRESAGQASPVDPVEDWLRGRGEQALLRGDQQEGAAVQWASRLWREARTVAAAEQRRRARFATALPAGVEVVDILEQEGDVHDLSRLAELARGLLEAQSPSAER